ncbi:hypothetical protein TNCV_2171101 [Trichonephila clavipes]|nr:hypothetical protein TNCV_2171101 [Trichonephila clavipes]
MINGRMRLHVVANGTMTGQRYIDEVLLPHVRLFRGAVGDKFVFMDDNATCHRTLAVQDCLDSEDALGRQVAGRNYPPTNKNTLIRALTEEWDKLPQQLLDNVVQSMVIGGGLRSAPGLQDCYHGNEIVSHNGTSRTASRILVLSTAETELPVRLINTTNEQRLVQGHETTPLRVKRDIEDVYSELDNGGQRLHFWMKRPELYCSGSTGTISDGLRILKHNQVTRTTPAGTPLFKLLCPANFVAEFNRQIQRGGIVGSMGTTNLHRTWCHNTRLFGKNRDNNSRREDDAPDEEGGQKNAGFWNAVDYLKLIVYVTPVDTEKDFTAWILVASADITSTPDLLERVWQSFIRRCRLCYDLHGRNLE